MVAGAAEKSVTSMSETSGSVDPFVMDMSGVTAVEECEAVALGTPSKETFSLLFLCVNLDKAAVSFSLV